MGIRMVGLCLAMVAWLGSGTAAAQDASILGAVTDETKGALPGVTVTATAIETGRVFTAVSDERGEYRLRGLPPARYKVTAELTGFSTVVVADVEVLVGQNRTVPFTMKVASLEETVTVTGESPLVDISSVSSSTDGSWWYCRSRAAIGWSWRCRCVVSRPTPWTTRRACATGSSS